MRNNKVEVQKGIRIVENFIKLSNSEEKKENANKNIKPNFFELKKFNTINSKLSINLKEFNQLRSNKGYLNAFRIKKMIIKPIIKKTLLQIIFNIFPRSLSKTTFFKNIKTRNFIRNSSEQNL